MALFDEYTKARIIQLASDIDSIAKQKMDAVAAQEFGRAAELRDQQNELREELNRLELPSCVVRNLDRLTANSTLGSPVLDLLRPEPGNADSDVVKKFPSPPESPMKLVIGSIPYCPLTTLSSALATDDIGSPFFQTAIPLFSLETLKPASVDKMAEFIWVAFREVARWQKRRPVVVSVVRPFELNADQMLDGILRGLEETDCDFVIFEQRIRLDDLRSRIKVDYTQVDC